MRLSGQEQFGYAGVTLRTSGGTLVIYVAQLSPDRGVLVLDGEALCEISPETVQERPALCVQCQHRFWWWRAADSRPACLFCDPPDAEWKAATWQEAEAFIMRRTEEGLHGEIAWATRVLDFCLAHGGRTWSSVQKLAFMGRVPGLVIPWMGRQEQQP